MLLEVVDLGAMPYAEAYAIQTRTLDEVLARRDVEGSPIGRLLLVEHDPPVITVSRRPDAIGHLLADKARLDALGVTVEATDRGGDITYHGPGQLVAYPIIDLNRAGLRLHGYMRRLEEAVIRVCAELGVRGERDADATGVWVGGAKICAMGVRVRRWVSMHGLALNVTTDLSHFDLIVPCGLAGRGVTSLAREVPGQAPSMSTVKALLAEALERELADQMSP